MSKVIFLDVDGTLIDYEAKTPASAKKAVELARANGHRVYICIGCSKAEVLQRASITGRCFPTVRFSAWIIRPLPHGKQVQKSARRLKA